MQKYIMAPKCIWTLKPHWNYKNQFTLYNIKISKQVTFILNKYSTSTDFNEYI